MALDDSRMQNRFLTKKCLALAEVVSHDWKNQEADQFLARVAAVRNVEQEGDTVRIDDTVVLRIVDGRIASVDTATCD